MIWRINSTKTEFKDVAAVIADFNGTMADTDKSTWSVNEKKIGKHMGETDPQILEQIRENLKNGIKPWVFLKDFFPKESQEKINLCAQDIWNTKKQVISKCNMFEGTKESVKRLDRNNILIAVSSHTCPKMIRDRLVKSGLYPYVYKIYGEGDGNDDKANHVKHFQEITSLKQNQIAFISDNTKDMGILPLSIGLERANREKLKRNGAKIVFETFAQAASFILEAKKASFVLIDRIVFLCYYTNMVHPKFNMERGEDKDKVIFDLNGTLLDSVREAIKKTAWLIEEIFGKVEQKKAKELFSMISNGIDIKEILDYLFPQESEEKRMLFANEFERKKKEIIMEAKAFPGIREAFAELHAQGFEIAVCTKIPEDLIWYCLKKEGLSEYVTFALGRESGTKKDNVKKILSEAEISEDEAVFISDNTEDLSLLPHTIGIGKDKEKLRGFGATQVFETTVEAIDFILGPKQPVLFLFAANFFKENPVFSLTNCIKQVVLKQVLICLKEIFI